MFRNPRIGRDLVCRATPIALAFGLLCTGAPVKAQVTAANRPPIPANAPAWLPAAYRSLIDQALPSSAALTGVGPSIPAFELDANGSGVLATYQPGGATPTAGNAFFQSLGTNGRSCVTCHQPASAMSLSLSNIQARYLLTLGTDPLFAPVDGANCPNTSGPAILHPANYSLLLTRGLIRIALPVPQDAQFTIKVVSDPNGCNTLPAYNTSTDPNTGIKSQIISVYRRPMMASNLKYKVYSSADPQDGSAPTLPPINLVTGAPLATDPSTGLLENGNIMHDGREPTLTSQAIDATLTHAQAKTAPTAAQLAQIVAFESGIYSAQYTDYKAGSLFSGGVTGGPGPIAAGYGGLAPAQTAETISSYDAWNPANVAEVPSRASIYRGQQLFNFYPFFITQDAGLNNVPGIPSPFTASCATCHGQINGATDTHPIGQHTIGIGGIDAAFGGPAPSNLLPIFQITCNAGYSTPFNGTTVLTNDPGKALVTGQCADIGRFTTAPMHGLAARAPYFTDGSAATLTDVVTFYNKRFNMNLTAQNIQDLVAFMSTL